MSKRSRERDETLRVSFRSSVRFERLLVAFRSMYEGSDRKDILTAPYVMLCATSLEAILNDALSEHAEAAWGGEGPPHLDGLLSMTLRGKLNAIVPLLTSNRFWFDTSHWVYQRLASLISVRNGFVHPKPEQRNFAITRTPSPEFGGPPSFPVLPQKYYQFVGDLTMGAGAVYSPIEYHEAIEKFDKWFLRRLPNGISKVAMLVRREQG